MGAKCQLFNKTLTWFKSGDLTVLQSPIREKCYKLDMNICYYVFLSSICQKKNSFLENTAKTTWDGLSYKIVEPINWKNYYAQ